MTNFSAAQKSFLVQYLSIILIILSILVGAVNKNNTPKKTTNNYRYVQLSPDNLLKSELYFENIFDEESGEINSQELVPLKEMLESHNLDLKLIISSRNKVETRVSKLAKVLREQGFWKDSFSVFGQNDPNIDSTKVVVKFRREAI